MTHRILHVIPTLDRSGAEKQLSLLARGLPREEFEVHVCALTRGGPLEAESRAAGIPVTVIGKRWKIDPLAFARLRRLVLELRPERDPHLAFCRQRLRPGSGDRVRRAAHGRGRTLRGYLETAP